MLDHHNLETPVLVNMINAHSANYGRELTEEEATDRNTTIRLLRSEIESRKQAGFGLPVIKLSWYTLRCI